MRIGVLFLSIGILALPGCGGGGNAKSAWNDVIKRCAAASLNGKNVLFFGASNAVGAGSVWRKANDGVYRLRWDISQMPDPKNFTAPFTPSTCDGTSSKQFKFGADATLDATALSAEAKADFAKAREVSAKATSVAWVPVAEGAYEAYYNGLPDGGVKTDLTSGNMYVMTRAFKVSGFTASLKFSSEVAAGLKAKFPDGPLPAGLVGNLGGGLNAQWDNSGTLNLTTAGDFYIAGEFQPFSPTGFAGPAQKFGPKVEVASDAAAQRDSN